jgi:phage gpG-like protein
MAKTGLKVIGLKKTQKKMRDFKSLIRKGDKKIFQEVGKVGVDIIKKRTAKSKDVDGKKFIKYSEAYAAKKGSSHVDLRVSGKMLRALNFQAFAKKVRFYVKKNKRKGKLNSFNLAVVHNFGARIIHGGKAYPQKKGKKYLPVAKMPKREFMGFMRNEEKKLFKMIRVFLVKKAKAIFNKK